MAGWVRLRGPLQVRPCKLGRRIHAAHAPATGPTPPSTDLRDPLKWHCLRLPCAWPALGGCRPWSTRRSTPCVDALRSIVEIFELDGFIHAWRGSTRSRKSVRGGAVSDCGVSAAWMRLPSLQGRTCGVPAIRHRPATPRNASFCCCCCLGRCRAQPCQKHKKKQQAEACCFGVMVRPERFELPTAWFVARYSIQLSYGRQLHKLVVLIVCGAPGEIRTPDRLVRSQVLYPTELRARGTQSTYYSILLHFQRRMLKVCRVVRPERFELPTAWFVARYSIQLSYGRPATGAELCGCRRESSTLL